MARVAVTRVNDLQRETDRATSLATYMVLGLCLLSFVRGIYELGERSLWWDESLSHYRATRPFSFILSNQMTFVDGDRQIPITPDNHPPFYFVLLRLVLLAAGDGEFALRYLSLASGVLVIPLLYQCGRRLYSPGSGVWAALLGAASPLYLWAQQEARPYALLVMLATFSFYALVRIVQLTPSPGDRARRQLTVWIAAYMLSTAAMLTTHYHSFFLLPAHGITFVLAPGRHKRLTLAALSATGAIAIPLLVWAIRMMPRQASVPGYEFISLGTLLQDVFRSFPLGVTGTANPLLRAIPFYWIGAGLLLAAGGALLARRQGNVRLSTLYLLLCICVPIATIYALSFVRPTYMNIRHLIAASPFYYLLLAAGIAQALRLKNRQRLWASIPLGLGTGTLLIGMLLSTQAYLASYAKEDHRGWGRYLGRHLRPDDLVLINPGASAQLYFYYVDNQASWLGFPPLGASPEETIHQLQDIAAQNDRLWIAQSLTPYWANPGDLTLTWLRENTTRFASAGFESANTTVLAEGFLTRPPLLDALPRDAAPIALDFGDRLRLLGLEAPVQPVPAGHLLRLSLYWSPTRPLEQDYRMTLSLRDERGFSWVKLDRAPYDGGFPTRRWPAGRLVRHDVDLGIPPGTPPGTYRLLISVYPEDHSGPALAVRESNTDNLQGLIVAIAEIDVTTPERPPLAQEIAIDHKTPQRYGDLALLGHTNDGGTYSPGDLIRLDAYWKAVRAPRRDIAFHLQVVDERDQLLVSRLLPPAGDYEPTRWVKGEIVRGRYRLRIPIDAPEGDYIVYIAPAQDRPAWPWNDGRTPICALTVRAPDEQPAFDIPPIQHTLSGNLNDEVELLGYDLEGSTVRPGQAISCTLYWRALDVIDRDYTVFTHLTAPDGRTWGQWDNQPQGGRAPTVRWVPGQVIADPYQIPLSADAPPGRLELRVGMYDRQRMTRLPLRGQDGTIVGDYVAVAELEVTAP